jgi:hypothetical protein
MSTNPAPSPVATAPNNNHLLAGRTYQYLRCSLVGMLIALAAAVEYQTHQQGKLLSSISAYYYTSAQAIFVGALIGLGVAMVALKGITEVEDVALNLAGMFAPVIAVVPTERDQAFQDARKACSLSHSALLSGSTSAPDCPTVQALIAATKANVQNNMFALLVAGGLAVIITALLVWLGRTGSAVGLGTSAAVGQPVGSTKTHRWGLGLAAALYLAALLAFTINTDWFIHHAHYISASGLFLCIFVVVVANAVRKNKDAGRAVAVPDLIREEGRGYLFLAAAMVAAGAIFGILVATGTVTLFWLEAVLIAFFAVFWVAQTWEQWGTGQ